jgi:hypothetical protein
MAVTMGRCGRDRDGGSGAGRGGIVGMRGAARAALSVCIRFAPCGARGGWRMTLA